MNEDFDWNDFKNGNQIFRYRDRDSIKLSRKQLEILSLYDGSNFTQSSDIEVNSVITGVLKSINKTDIVVDINYKDCVYVDNKHSEFNVISGFQIGDEVSVMIKNITESPYHIKGSFIESVKIKVNEKFIQYYNEF